MNVVLTELSGSLDLEFHHRGLCKFPHGEEPATIRLARRVIFYLCVEQMEELAPQS